MSQSITSNQKQKLMGLLLSKYGTKTFPRSAILKTLVEDLWGGKYHPCNHRGVSGINLSRGGSNRPAGYLVRPTKTCKIYLSSTERNVWQLKGIA